MLVYPDIFFTEQYQELLKNTEFGGEPCYFGNIGIDYRFYKRPIEGTPYYDISSPYGYSGPCDCFYGRWDLFQSEFGHYCQQNNIIAEFARLHPWIENHKKLDYTFERDIYYVDLTQSEEQIWKGFDKGCKSAIKKGTKPVTFHWFIPARFYELYDATMSRADARSAYWFNASFLSDAEHLLGGLPGSLWSACIWDAGRMLNGAILLKYGDYCHYFLSAKTETSNETNYLIWESIKWAKMSGCKIFNLGGGLKAGDSLESFKRSFSHLSKPWYTYRKIHNQEVYDRLCQDKRIDPRSGGFFPAYRRLIDTTV